MRRRGGRRRGDPVQRLGSERVQTRERPAGLGGEGAREPAARVMPDEVPRTGRRLEDEHLLGAVMGHHAWQCAREGGDRAQPLDDRRLARHAGSNLDDEVPLLVCRHEEHAVQVRPVVDREPALDDGPWMDQPTCQQVARDIRRG